MDARGGIGNFTLIVNITGVNEQKPVDTTLNTIASSYKPNDTASTYLQSGCV
jgi:hypothetical protein